MSKFSLGKEMSIEVTARLIAKGSDTPVTSDDIVVKFYDKDFFDDDFLGEASPDKDGRVSFIFNPEAFDRKDPIREKSLDFYFVVYKNGLVIFRSQVMEHVDVDAVETFKMGEGEVIDLGSFLIDTNSP
jgi:hypothetical protein